MRVYEQLPPCSYVGIDVLAKWLKRRKSLPGNFEDNLESGNIKQDKFPDTTFNSSQPTVCGEIKDGNTIKSKQIVDNKGSLSTSIVRSFVQINGINLENISKLTTLPECRNSLEYEEESSDLKTLRKMLILAHALNELSTLNIKCQSSWTPILLPKKLTMITIFISCICY